MAPKRKERFAAAEEVEEAGGLEESSSVELSEDVDSDVPSDLEDDANAMHVDQEAKSSVAQPAAGDPQKKEKKSKKEKKEKKHKKERSRKDSERRSKRRRLAEDEDDSMGVEGA